MKVLGKDHSLFHTIKFREFALEDFIEDQAHTVNICGEAIHAPNDQTRKVEQSEVTEKSRRKRKQKHVRQVKRCSGIHLFTSGAIHRGVPLLTVL